MQALKTAVILLALLLLAGCESQAPSTQAPQVIAFSATWCGPCQADKPHLKALRDEGVSVQEIDVDQDRATAQQYAVGRVPTYIVVDAEGKIVERTHDIWRAIKVIRWLLSLP